MPSVFDVSTIDRNKFKSPFRENGLTDWNCPSCGKGFLKIRKGTFHREETSDSKSVHSNLAWEPHWIEYLYSCLLECDDTACKDIVASSGTGSVKPYMDFNNEGSSFWNDVDWFFPKYFYPNLKLFNYPKNIPDKVRFELENSFSLFFCDPPASANHVRMALENLLTHMRINKTLTRNGKRRYLSLHQRIQRLPKTYQDIQEIFLAVKWLGNAGSHSGTTVSSDDVLDAYELMEKLLVEVFDDDSNRIKALAKKINRNKGPAKTILSP